MGVKWAGATLTYIPAPRVGQTIWPVTAFETTTRSGDGREGARIELAITQLVM